MAPKATPPLAKQALILTWLQNSLTVHNIKDLEKALPQVASINGMQVKDYLQALSDEGKIRVEKIGSGNWYWSFLSEEKKTREAILEKLQEEKTKVDAAVEELESRVEEASAARDDDGDNHGDDRKGLVEMHAALLNEVQMLRAELATYSDNDPTEVVRKRDEVEGWKVKAGRWTDNIFILEAYLREVTGNDKEQIENIRAMFYGGEYVEGEGLKEL